MIETKNVYVLHGGTHAWCLFFDRDRPSAVRRLIAATVQ